MHQIDTEEQPGFFAPTRTTAIDHLITGYRQQLQCVEAVAAYADGEDVANAFGYFFRGARKIFDRYTPAPTEVFNLQAAVAALNAEYWSRAMQLTDVLDFMPDKRRSEWLEAIREMKTPEFEEESVKATMADLLAKRMDFLSEMVDGIFTGLSHEHVTNQPEGFSKRMIIDGVYGSWGYQDKKAGLIHDMRGIIAKFMGRDPPSYGATRGLLDRIRMNTGVWHTVDGGAFRIRVYKKGTAHLEVHQQLAYRLNQVLAHLHPMAIPSKFRERQKKVRTAFELIQRPLPFAVLELLSDAKLNEKGSISRRKSYEHEEERWPAHTLCMGYHGWEKADRHLRKAVASALEVIGGARLPSRDWFVFDYNPKEVIRQIIISGTLPDEKSHQFYPTQERLAGIVRDLAGVSAEHTCLEPSAGQGGLAGAVGEGKLTCVEVSALNCTILREKGYHTVQADFLTWQTVFRFDRIIMNPPYSEGRWRSHTEKAATLLAPGGRLVAILPASAQGKYCLPGLSVQWHGPYANEFPGTSISVVVMVADKVVGNV